MGEFPSHGITCSIDGKGRKGLIKNMLVRGSSNFQQYRFGFKGYKSVIGRLILSKWARNLEWMEVMSCDNNWTSTRGI